MRIFSLIFIARRQIEISFDIVSNLELTYKGVI